jgi:putative peptide zinc metalloprotease protein
MGVMLLVLTPCLYCNVSDSWTLPSKWRRAAIAAAGMYVELILAAVGVFVWWFSQPGMVNQLALNIVFVSSVSTILFNGNPLLRYDGYYILSDLLEIPNLRQKASSIVQRQLAFWVLGIRSRPDHFLPNRKKWLFALYSVAAVAYRWLITFSIFWFLYSLLEPYGAGVVGQLIAMFAIWGLVGMPLLHVYRFFSVPGRFGSVNRMRAALSGIILSTLLGGIMLIPIPHYVRSPFTIEPRAAENVYVDVPGTIRTVYVKHGEYVQREQPLLTLESDELALQIVNLQGAIRTSKTRYDTLLRASHSAGNDRYAVDDLELARTELESAQADLNQRQQELEKLQIRAGLSGWLLAPLRVPRKKNDTGEMETWFGHPLERRNQGSFLDQSTVVARIVPDTGRMEAILMVDQSDIEFVQRGQPVDLFPTLLPGTTITAATATISNTRLKSVPMALASRFGGDVVTARDDNGVDVPQSAIFQVSVPFDNVDDMILDGCTGRARIRTGSQTVGSRIWRIIQKTFRFDL